MKGYAAYLQRMIAAAECSADAKRDDVFSDGFNRALWMLSNLSKLRDPILDPKPGDVLAHPTMFGCGARIIVVRLVEMRHRGAKGNLRRRHVATRIEPNDGRSIEHRGRTYTLEGFERLCAAAVVVSRADSKGNGERRG